MARVGSGIVRTEQELDVAAALRQFVLEPLRGAAGVVELLLELADQFVLTPDECRPFAQAVGNEVVVLVEHRVDVAVSRRAADHASGPDPVVIQRHRQCEHAPSAQCHPRDQTPVFVADAGVLVEPSLVECSGPAYEQSGTREAVVHRADGRICGEEDPGDAPAGVAHLAARVLIDGQQRAADRVRAGAPRGVDERRDVARIQCVVVVAEGDVLTRGVAQAGVPCRAEVEVVLSDDPDGPGPALALDGEESLERFPFGTSVVDHEDLDGGVGLRDRGGDRCSQVRPLVVVRDHDGDRRRVRARPGIGGGGGGGGGRRLEQRAPRAHARDAVEGRTGALRHDTRRQHLLDPAGEGRSVRIEQDRVAVARVDELRIATGVGGEERDSVLDALVDDVRELSSSEGITATRPGLERYARAPACSRSPSNRSSPSADRTVGWIAAVTASGVIVAARPRNVTVMPASCAAPRRFSASMKTRTPFRSSRRPKNTSSVRGGWSSTSATMASSLATWPSVKYGITCRSGGRFQPASAIQSMRCRLGPTMQSASSALVRSIRAMARSSTPNAS